MGKMQRISDYQYSISFLDNQANFEVFYDRFLQSNLGKIYTAIPWEELVASFGVKESRKGPTSFFSPKGKIALMFLKHYAGCSDQKLIEQLNGNIEYQYFCDLHLGTERLSNYKIVSEIRCELARQLSIEELEAVLYSKWKDSMDNKGHIVMDATCYESELWYPTDQKLLWQSVKWSYKQLRQQCKLLHIPLPRTKYNKWSKRYSAYSKMRRKPKAKRIVLTRSLLHLLNKLNGLLDDLATTYTFTTTKQYQQRRLTIKQIYDQQHQLFYFKEKPKHRIVHIEKHYIRPIVRGKEVKPVEYGAKVNKLQIDGINFIEHLSFDAFHEGNRFQSTIHKAQQLTHTKVNLAGADAIYATNANRTYCSKNNIRTDFKRKGRAGKHEQQRKKLAALITKERASRLEGSFGKEKEHYHLKKVKAKTKPTEILWIFFGIHTANALEIGRRMAVEKANIKLAA